MKSLIVGLILEAIIIVASLIGKNEDIFIYGSAIIGLGAIVLSMLLSGLMGGNIYRRTSVENEEERDKRYKKSLNLMILGAPAILAIVIFYYIKKL